MKPTRLPAPAMPLLTPHDEYSMAHLIERHIDFVTTDKDGNERNVALDPIFVRHFMKYRDSKLPVVTAIVTSLLVLPDGTLLATQGIDRKRGIIFRLQPELIALLPDQADCTAAAVADAMRLLIDVWLVDVATDYAGKCILIAAAISILERAVLPERPAFFVTAGQRGGGKTTPCKWCSSPRQATARQPQPGQRTRKSGASACSRIWGRVCPPSSGTISRAARPSPARRSRRA